jgi:hypothetical protein
VLVSVILLVLSGAPALADDAEATQDGLTIENARAVYFPSERVDIRYSNCAPLAITRLELRTARNGGVALANYPAPFVNVAGSVRASVILPDNLPRGEAFLVLSCASATGPLVRASASLVLDLPSAAVAGSTAAVYVPVLYPVQPTEATEDLAVTGISVLPIAAGFTLALVLAGGALVFTRRRGGPQWSPAGMPMSGPR